MGDLVTWMLVALAGGVGVTAVLHWSGYFDGYER